MVADYWQDEILDNLLFQGKIKNGFFIEAGAWDFTNTSNSLWYELKHNWTGLLIEPLPEQCFKGYIHKSFIGLTLKIDLEYLSVKMLLKYHP